MLDGYLGVIVYLLIFAAGAGLVSYLYHSGMLGLNPYAAPFVRPKTIQTIKANHLLPEDPVLHLLDSIYKPGTVTKRKTID